MNFRDSGDLLGANRVQKVWVAAEPVSVLRNPACLFVILSEVFSPSVIVVVRLGALKTIQHRFVVVNNFGKIFDSGSSVQ